MTTSDPRLEPLSNLLVPTDFSKGAEAALGCALLLPLAQGAFQPRPDRKRRRTRNDKLASRARGETPDRNVAVTSEVLSGEAFVEIIRRSRSLGAELIVIGRHGRRPVRDMFIGTTAERVIRKGDVPVLVVNRKPRSPYRRPLIATDLEDALALRR